VDPMNPARIP